MGGFAVLPLELEALETLEKLEALDILEALENLEALETLEKLELLESLEPLEPLEKNRASIAPKKNKAWLPPPPPFFAAIAMPAAPIRIAICTLPFQPHPTLPHFRKNHC